MNELTGVPNTAVGAAWGRARESARPDRLFDDPYASAFVAAAGYTAASGELFADHLAFRTRFFDGYLTGSGCRQVVLLAAGLDSRAYRLDWAPGVRVFELDLPELLAFKERVLADMGARPSCERVAVPVDLREDWPGALRAAGFEAGEPAAWLAEGLLIYLDAGESARLLTGVGELSARGSRLAFEHDPAAAAGLMERARTMPRLRRVAELWRGGLGEDAAAWLGECGWRTRTFERAALAAEYGRPSTGRGGFLVAERDADHETDGE
ncbi:SAM-dependent methyltransferase [Nonomuraea zeae]|uniref:S-adenosyl-L-methionine-dependent methyltransferase n=1 Tax=Nonomuraea zeae TaxID=1642303 RepID=A0A5S4FHE6_9ACTN|nr:SAM-dependent methyltransferase [Nonomuraea zeae]TMR18334.1 SAM-dependent methyltransferase [Nonomuraea zeae]